MCTWSTCHQVNLFYILEPWPTTCVTATTLRGRMSNLTIHTCRVRTKNSQTAHKWLTSTAVRRKEYRLLSQHHTFDMSFNFRETLKHHLEILQVCRWSARDNTVLGSVKKRTIRFICFVFFSCSVYLLSRYGWNTASEACFADPQISINNVGTRASRCQKKVVGLF